MANKPVARAALRQALAIRAKLQLDISSPICIYDVTDQLGVEVRFVELPSLEGLYLDLARPTILVSSLRPAGRRRFTCGHELGHYLLGHGTRADEIADTSARRASTYDVDEFAADCFSGFLLMPKTAVAAAFAARGLKLAFCTGTDVYIVAQQFGVGYRTLLHHMSRSIGLIAPAASNRLAKIPLSAIRADILGASESRNVIVVDRHWRGRAVDVEVGDLLVLRDGILVRAGRSLEPLATRPADTIFRASNPGIASLWLPHTEWAKHVRVSRSAYTGRSVFRHLDEPDGE